MRIGIVGNGVVGSATARCYMEQHEVRIWDKVEVKTSHSLEDTLESDIVFLCLPESEVDDFCNMLGRSAAKGHYVIRSTLPIGTTRRIANEYGIDVVHSPEFLTARRAFTDVQCPARNIIGKPTKEGNTGGKLLRLYMDRFPGVPYHLMSSDESEAVKLATNSFFAVKVAFFNEMNLLCEKLGLDWDTVLKGILSDGRIAHSHTQVPGPDGKYGFGGACLPKDLLLFVTQLHEAGMCAEVTGGALNRNLFDRERVPK